MKQFQVSSFRFQVGATAVATANIKLQTSNFKLGTLILALGAMFLLMPAGALPQVVNDPTRPPGSFATGEPDVAGDAGGGLVLQSVMISSTRRAAIINGEMVKLGEKYGDAVLVKVTENEVVLKSGDTTQVLKMYPGVEKRESVQPAKTAPKRARAASNPAAADGAKTR